MADNAGPPLGVIDCSIIYKISQLTRPYFNVSPLAKTSVSSLTLLLDLPTRKYTMNANNKGSQQSLCCHAQRTQGCLWLKADHLAPKTNTLVHT